MSGGDAVDAMLAAAASASKEDAMDAMLDEAARQTEADKAEAASAAAASEPEFVLWQGRLGHLHFHQGSRSGLCCAKIIDAVSQGGARATFYVDARLGARQFDGVGDSTTPVWVGSGVYDQMTFQFAVEQNLPVTFWGRVEHDHRSTNRAACLTQAQKVMLMAAVGSARRELELQVVRAAQHPMGFLRQPQPMDFPLSQLEHHRELHGQAALPMALKQALQPLLYQLEQIKAGQVELQSLQVAGVGHIRHDISALRAVCEKFVVLSSELKQAAEISYHEHVQANPAADENTMPVLFEEDGTSVGGPIGKRPAARAACLERASRSCKANIGKDWMQYDATAPLQGQYTVYAGRETGSTVERPYHCPTPEQKLRRTISMYKALRSKFGGRPLGRATTAEVRTAIAAGALGAGWRAACGFGPDTEFNVRAPHL